MTPGPKTATERGRVSQEKTSSFTTRRSPAPASMAGTAGREPVAITTDRALMRVWPSTSIVLRSTKRALPATRSAAGIFSTPSSTKPTKRSRSRFTRPITSRPSTRFFPSTCTPNPGASSMAWAASAAAMRSLDGMQPTRAQVVPWGPDSMITARAPRARAAR